MDNGMDQARTLSGLETMREGDSLLLAGRYKVVRRLGEGGMGSVWLAEDSKLDNRQVAVKMLPAVLAGKKGAYRQVKQEALMAMKLSHPNIATVRAFEEDEGGSPFLVMDYIEGTGLDDILAEKGKLSEAEMMQLLGPVAAALDYAHAKGVVHRDVKPGNVIVDKNGTPFVLDFGIAREIQETMTRVTGKLSSGTLMYMSPEQLRGRAPKAAQDVYSFAAMAYECLTGTPPFSRGQIEYQIVNENPEPLPADVAGEALRQGVMAGLAKEPEARPGTCAGVLGRDEAAKREREKREAEEVRRKREAEALRAREQARMEEERRRQRESAERFAREKIRAEAAQRQKDEELEAERKARKEAEAAAREARRKAQAEELEAQRAQEARGRAAGWAWFLAIVLVLGGLVAYGVWQQEHETTQAKVRSLQQEAAAQRRAQQEAEAKWKAEAEAQRKAQAEAEARWKAEAEAQRKAQAESERKAKEEARQELERQRAEAERKAEQERQMKPSILLKATLNGREVAATVTEGLARSGLTTPVTVNLESGGSYGFAAEYEAGGKKFAGRTTVQAKDWGVTEAAVALEEREGEVKRVEISPSATPTMLENIPPSWEELMGEGWKEKLMGEGMDVAEWNVLTLDLGSGVKLEMVHCPGVAADFWMGKYEVTQEQWRQVTGKSPSHFGGRPRNPVECVSWNDCQDFVKALNALPAARNSGLTFRLPEEREWEKACRAGAPESADYCKLADGTQITGATLSRVARYGKDWEDGPVAVGSFQPNAWGLYDMHGNVWEWTQTADGGGRVDRGGCFGTRAGGCAAGIRLRFSPDQAYGNRGLRLAASGRAATR